MKIGKRGCYIRNAAGAMIVPACKGVTAIDTIGAGDNFASGFISALLQGKDIRDCGIYANCTAAISVQYVGATTGVRNKEMVEEMLEKYKKIISCNSNKSVTLRPAFVRMQGNPHQYIIKERADSK